MPIDFSTLVYNPAFNTFARMVTFYPVISQPGVPSFSGRGIFSTTAIDVVAIDGSIISEQQTILDVRDAEFTVVPRQKDRLFIPSDSNLPEMGMYEVSDTKANGGGETTLNLHKVVTARP